MGWIDQDVKPMFAGRILPVDAPLAERAGMIGGLSRRSGVQIGFVDMVLAATAEFQGLTLVTRNTKDFAAWNGPVLNPWAAA